MKKSIVIALSVVILLIITVGVVGLGSKKADCSKIEDSQLKKRCHLFNLLNSYGLVSDYDKFIKQKPYEKTKPKYFTSSFRDEAIDEDKDGRFDVLKIYAGVNISEAGDYQIESWLYDDNKQPFYHFEKTESLISGLGDAVIEIPSQKIREKKLSGNLKIEYVRLLKNEKTLETIQPEYYTTPYGYDDFSALLPDLVIKNVEEKDGKLKVIVANEGKKHAFVIFVDLKVGNDFVYGKRNPNQLTLLKAGDKHEFSIDLPNAKEFTVVVDPDNFVDESNETNNEYKIKLDQLSEATNIS